MGLVFEVIVSDFEEDLPQDRFASAADYARETATHKAIDVAAKAFQLGIEADLVVAADTVVEYAGDILEKPADAEDAMRVLSRLSGQKHHVHTGVALVLPKAADAKTGKPPLLHAFSETTAVEFDELSASMIQAYVATGEPFGKAGSYGIQQTAGSFVRGLQGCYFNVMGFPVHKFAKKIRQLVEQGQLGS